MKNECDIVKDLLFSYNDGVLSENSKQFVDDHIKTCIGCKKILEEIKQENTKKDDIADINIFKSINKKLNTKNIMIAISSLLLIIIIIFNILVYINYKKYIPTIKVYLKDGITSENLENIKNKIFEFNNNAELKYLSKKDELELMKEKFGEKSYLLNDTKEDHFKNSIEIKTKKNAQEIEKAIESMPGVDRITTHIKYNPYVLYYIQKIM